jgi:YD repeat-containing protein
MRDTVSNHGAFRAGDRKRTINAMNQITEHLAYDAAGRPTRVKDVNQIEHQFDYHSRGWLLARRVCQPGVVAFPCPNAAETSMTYTDWGGVKRMTPAGRDLHRVRLRRRSSA